MPVNRALRPSLPRREKHKPPARHAKPNSSEPAWPSDKISSRSRALPPSMVHQLLMNRRNGDNMPLSDACATTAKTRPESSARRLPQPASTSSRLEQPRASTMPQPNSRPPINAPDKVPCAAGRRAVPTTSAPNRMKPCVATSATEKASSHTHNLGPNLPWKTSSAAERRQNCDTCASAPNAMPIKSPPTASTRLLPNASINCSSIIFPFMHRRAYLGCFRRQRRVLIRLRLYRHSGRRFEDGG